MERDLLKILISTEDIQKKVKELGETISRDYQGQNLLVVGILKGSVIFMGDLIRAIKIPVQIDFMEVSSYGRSTESSGAVRILKDLESNIEGKNILIVEDIIDTGLTLSYLLDMLKARKPGSIRICTLLNKPSRRKASLKVDYDGYDIPDEFVVGYGLDYGELYRNLPFVGVLKPEIYARCGEDTTPSK
ncbi:hypoxanthine phosphoribosyltransferase [Dehalobacterium formicoaceticum]|uniref:Hypoxanthine phosphoribosyltransferase n=1 Tax=Dehalobacterium formicoaceticum TaxID=51515 RepID=A0ABT1Y3H3_9FIRM|nr:hypoxanthine phosphoribosyltransferase [Dehalobacterium formicoaceticum]MCR6545041.1 hypoxanthine phosphoribosyltransferase [Dehalobacterium formicoaceticum]